MRRAFEHFVGVASFFDWEHSAYVRNKFSAVEHFRDFVQYRGIYIAARWRRCRAGGRSSIGLTLDGLNR